jgi:hypothetical protein
MTTCRSIPSAAPPFAAASTIPITTPLCHMMRVKFFCDGIESSSFAGWRRQLPDAAPVLGGCEFVFDPQSLDYDWLVVYDRFPRVNGERFSKWREPLACPPEQTIFVTVEPSSIKFYEPGFLNQFGHVLTGHEPWSISHPGVIRSQPGLKWFYGDAGATRKSLDTMLAEQAPVKTRDLATVCSSKKQKHTLHSRRFEFTQRLKDALPGLDVFGHGVRPMADKAEAVDPYRYHIAIENHRCDHHWTEKVSDAFLGWALPIYCGCPNLSEYFPPESFIQIDIDNFEAALQTVHDAIASNQYEKRLEAIRAARERVLTRYNLFAVIDQIVNGGTAPEPHHPPGGVLLSRHALRSESLRNQLSFACQTVRRKWRGRFALASPPRPTTP